MDYKYKVIVAHPLIQHSDKLAAALKQGDMLYKYITTAYCKKWSWTNMSTLFLKGDNKRRIQAKKFAQLDDREVAVFCELLGMLMLVVNRLDKKKIIKNKMDRLLAKSFGRKVARYAIKHKVDAVVMYDLYAGDCFAYLEKKAPHIKRIMDASAAYVGHIREVYENDHLNGEIKLEDYHMNYPQYWDSTWCDSVLGEINHVEYVLAASNYSAKSYKEAGKNIISVEVIPYGIDGSKFKPKAKEAEPILKVLYVGSVTQGKGVQYLLEACKRIGGDKVEATIVGAVNSESALYMAYKDIEHIRFAGKCNYSEIEKHYQNADVLCFPSLSDAFGFVGLEAMSCELPVISTENCGVSDLVEEGKNGFVIPAGNTEAICEKLLWCCENRDRLMEMRTEARKTAEVYTWDRYNQRIIEVFSEFMKGME